MRKQTLELTEAKFSQLPPASSNGSEGYAYYCGLCDEILVLAKKAISPRKVALVFSETCPGCGFKLEKVMEGKTSRIPPGADLLANPKCSDAGYLLERSDPIELCIRKSSIPDPTFRITTGIDGLDRLIELRLGQLAAIHGETSQAFSSLLCVRGTLPKPLGLDSDVVFLDGGNSFDSYAISEQAIRHEVDSEETLRRIHLSRAFTYHQLSRLIQEKLQHAQDHFNAKLAVISDVSLLYCDPDVQNKRESLDRFRKDIRCLANLAEQKSALIVVTNLQTRNKRMEGILLHTTHVSVRFDDKNTFTQLSLVKHPSSPQLKATLPKNKQTLESYL